MLFVKPTVVVSATVSFALAMILLMQRAEADVRLARLFGNDMVLQQKTRAPVWGWAEPGESITMKLGDYSAQATAGADGKWRTALQTPGASGPYELVVSGKNTITLT